MQKKHTVAIIGLGHWYWAYPIMGAIKTRKDADIKWLVGENEKQAKEVSAFFNIPNCSLDYMDALKDEDVDVVVITTTTNLYEKIAVDAAAYKKDILIGKPVARTLAGADRIAAAVEKHGVKLVGYGAGPDPHDPIYTQVQEGKIGKPYAAVSSFRGRLPLQAPGDANPGWYCDADFAAGGAFIDHAIYAATRLGAIFDSRAVSVYAQMGKMVFQKYNVEDYGVAIIRFENGAIATIESTFGVTEYPQSSIVVTGDGGEISIVGNQLRLVGKGEAGQNPRITIMEDRYYVRRTLDEYADPFSRDNGGARAIVDELFDVIDNGKETLNNIQNARAGLEICLAAYKSVETGMPVSIPLSEDVDVPSILSNLQTLNS